MVSGCNSAAGCGVLHGLRCAAGAKVPIKGHGHPPAPAATAAVSDPDLPFPTLLLDETPPWQWPMPPGGARRFAAPPPLGTPQPCRIETQTGLTLHGTMLDFDPSKRRLLFRAAAGGTDASLPFASVRRLTLTVPLQPAARAADAPRKERAPAAAQERDYRLQQVGHANVPPLTGRTAGHVEAAEGMFLFSPAVDDGALCRLFVPRAAYSRCEFGASAEELAARHWIASPAQLIEALAQQERQPVVPLGQSLLALGLLTQAQLDRVLQRLDGSAALGETLVESGLVARADLQTALAHKMGFPLVDLERFPLDPKALALLPRRLAISHRVLPLLLDQGRLVVAVDRPGRVLKLRQLDAYAQMPIAPVLALKSQILVALNRQSGEGWNLHVSERASFFPTTI
jgi:hypothetical protein